MNFASSLNKRRFVNLFLGINVLLLLVNGVTYFKIVSKSPGATQNVPSLENEDEWSGGSSGDSSGDLSWDSSYDSSDDSSWDFPWDSSDDSGDYSSDYEGSGERSHDHKRLRRRSKSKAKWNEWEGLPGFQGPFATSDVCLLRQNSNRIEKQVYASLLFGDDYLVTLLKLHCSLKRVNSTRGFVVFYVAETVSPSTLAVLHSYGISTDPIEVLSFPNTFAKRFQTNWTKIRFWSKTNYDKIIYLDSDSTVVQNIDSLFSLPSVFATPADTERSACATPMGFNQAGLLVLVPCEETYNQMVSMATANETLQFQNSDAEQGFLNFYFQYTRILLPPSYSFLPHQYWPSPLRSGAKVIHYTHVKPFGPNPQLKDYHEPWLSCKLD